MVEQLKISRCKGMVVCCLPDVAFLVDTNPCPFLTAWPSDSLTVASRQLIRMHSPIAACACWLLLLSPAVTHSPSPALARLLLLLPPAVNHSLPSALACCSRCCLFLSCLCTSRHAAVFAVAVSVAHPAGPVAVPQAPRESGVPPAAAPSAGGGGRRLRGGAADPATASVAAPALCHSCCYY